MRGNVKNIIFDLPEDAALSDTIDEILKSNDLEESDEEFFDKENRGEEPRVLVVRDAALVLFEKKIPEDKLAEFLRKHLKISAEIAQKIVQDIKEKLIPFARIIDLEKERRKSGMQKPEETEELEEKPEEAPEEMAEAEKKEAFRKAREELMRKINAKKSVPLPKPDVPVSGAKNPVITNVEENAKNMPGNLARPEAKKEKTPPAAPKAVDPYKESVE